MLCYFLRQIVLLFKVQFSHCGFKMKNRLQFLDVYGGTKERTFDDEDVIDKFREGVGSAFLCGEPVTIHFLTQR